MRLPRKAGTEHGRKKKKASFRESSRVPRHLREPSFLSLVLPSLLGRRDMRGRMLRWLMRIPATVPECREVSHTQLVACASTARLGSEVTTILGRRGIQDMEPLEKLENEPYLGKSASFCKLARGGHLDCGDIFHAHSAPPHSPLINGPSFPGKFS